jgi:hypothetical protein
MKCSICGTANEPQANFCTECGARMTTDTPADKEHAAEFLAECLRDQGTMIASYLVTGDRRKAIKLARAAGDTLRSLKAELSSADGLQRGIARDN